MKKILLGITMLPMLALAQTLDDCQQAAEQNYPLIRQYALIEKTTQWTVANIQKGWLPQVAAQAQATYQTDVAAWPDQMKAMTAAMGIDIKGLTNDQYRLGIDVQQTIYDGGAIGSQKSVAREQGKVQAAHNEVNIYAVRKRVNEMYFSLLLIDEQIKLNSVLKKSNCPIPAIFVWLEEGGTNSHILFVNYQMPGCFECLYTDSNGEYVNNRARKNSSGATENGIIRNGCGGIRAAYGTAILLRTTAAMLNVIQDYDEHKIIANTLIDITPERITISDTEFPMEACNCCGDTAK